MVPSDPTCPDLNLRCHTPPHARIAVCSWSLGPDDESPPRLIETLAVLEIGAVQLALGPLVEARPEWADMLPALRAAGVEVASGMMAMAGEDYTTLESIARTGGVRPDETWPTNRLHAAEVARLAAGDGFELVTFHAGFLPHDRDDPRRGVMLERLRLIADLFGELGVQLALETGQESAETLLEVLADLERPNVGVNFDPANMILYGQGEPVDGLRRLAPHVRQIHVKDAVPAETPATWGREVPVGRGAVDWPAFVAVAEGIEPPVRYVIEREAGRQRAGDIAAARDLVSDLLKIQDERA